jgi:hypothetical protein
VHLLHPFLHQKGKDGVCDRVRVGPVRAVAEGREHIVLLCVTDVRLANADEDAGELVKRCATAKGAAGVEVAHPDLARVALPDNIAEDRRHRLPAPGLSEGEQPAVADDQLLAVGLVPEQVREELAAEHPEEVRPPEVPDQGEGEGVLHFATAPCGAVQLIPRGGNPEEVAEDGSG